MAGAIRTQIYLTAEQRRRLDERSLREGKPIAQLIREALDAYAESEDVDPGEALQATFGAIPGIEVPSRDEWQRG